jgi:hypothetical protein
MGGKQQAGTHRQEERPGVRSRLRATPRGTRALPSWESFPVADRHRLVSALLRTARHQVAAGPVSRLPTR